MGPIVFTPVPASANSLPAPPPTDRHYFVIYLIKTKGERTMKHIFISLFIINTILQFLPIQSTWAASTKCIAKIKSGSCSNVATSSFYNKTDWNVSCTINGKSMPLSGTSICSSTEGDAGDTRTSVTISSNLDDNIYCWCKMTTPAVSLWARRYRGSNAAACAQYCAGYCAGFGAQEDYRNAIFNNLAD